MKHRILCSLFFLMAVRWMMIPMVFAQPEPSTENSTNINCEALVFESNHLDHARLGIYLQVPYNEISFVNEDREYIGRYEIFASLQDSTQQQVWQQDQSVELHAKDFSQTISSRLSSAKQFSVLLDSGTIFAASTDHRSGIKKIDGLQTFCYCQFIPPSAVGAQRYIVGGSRQ